MERYRKLIVASLGLVLLIGSNLAGVELGPEDEAAAVSIVDAVILLLTSFGVFQVKNEPAA